MANQQTDKRTASQRIEDLERAVMSLYQTSNQMARDLMTLRETAKLLNNKADAMCKASLGGEPLNDTVISRIMLENNINELKGKVKNLIDQGLLEATDTIAEGTFVVGNESDKDGKVANARLQFTLSSLDQAVQKALLGKKVGEAVTFEGDKLLFNVTEVYTIVPPKPAEPQAVAEPKDVTPAPVQEAAPAEQSSNNADTSSPAAPVAEQPSQPAGN